MIDTALIRCGLLGHRWGKIFETTDVYPDTAHVRMVHRRVCERCLFTFSWASYESVDAWLSRPVAHG